ncbi:UDP-glucose 4-epimerase [Paraburkholderia aromaticivorans]|uniref:UDP-glucose 4-epimerase n=1 Tax=Paraburkholderia aromaticivorans TaxID=2026199 RepID=A0A248VJ95_9BURK|nr:UDP-glucose 4-epimerase [Paraburkholderia aromaticivorans]ASV99050.1 UDP-glucose 4-epimerase [Paraburkholderia aromaticivorans]
MTISGNVGDGDWSVAATTHPTAGGFDCSIQLSHHTPEGVFTHEFRHSSIFPTEREAVLAGLREGMDWVRLKMSNTLSVQPGACPVDPIEPE